MSPFIRKEHPIDAIRWRTGGHHPAVEVEGDNAYLRTDIGRVVLKDGDWIIKDPFGPCFHAMSNEVFVETHAPANTYDRADRVRRGAYMSAGPLKIAEYTVLDPAIGAHTTRQFHMTYDNTVLAVMDEGPARLFTKFVFDTLEPEKRDLLMRLATVCRTFISTHQISCAEAIYQRDSVAAAMGEFVEEVADLIGYWKRPEEAPTQDAAAQGV